MAQLTCHPFCLYCRIGDSEVGAKIYEKAETEGNQVPAYLSTGAFDTYLDTLQQRHWLSKRDFGTVTGNRDLKDYNSCAGHLRPEWVYIASSVYQEIEILLRIIYP